MGASIGYVTAQAGIDVVLIDRDQASADKGKAVFRQIDQRAGQARAAPAQPTATHCSPASRRRRTTER